MAAPSVISKERDISTRVASTPGIYEAIVIKATKGELNQPRLITSENNLLKYYTPNDTIDVGMDLGYFSALAALEKTNKLWVMRAANNPKYGAFLYHIDGSITQVEQTGEYKKNVTFKVSEIKEGSTEVTISDISSGTIEDLKGREIHIDKVGYYKVESVAGNVATLKTAITTSKKLPEHIDLTIPENKVTVNATFNYKDLTHGATNTVTIYDVAGDHAEVTDFKKGTKFKLANVATEFTVKTVANGVTAKEKVITIDGAFAGTEPTTGTGTSKYEKVLRPLLKFVLTNFKDGSDKLTVTMNTGDIESLKLVELDLTAHELEKYTVTNVDKVKSEITLDKKIDNPNIPNESTGKADEVKLTAKGLVDPTTYAMDDTVLFMVYGCNPGAWNNNVRVRIQTNYKSKRKVQKTDQYGNPLYFDDHGAETTIPSLNPVMVDEETEFNPVKVPGAFLIQVYTTKDMVNPMEEYTVSRDPDAKDGYGQSIYIEDATNSSNYIRIIDNVSVDKHTIIPTMNKTEAEYESNILRGTPYDVSKTYGYYGLMVGGNDGLPVTDSNMILAANKFRSKISYPITVLLDGGWATPAYQKALISIAEERKDCIAVLSTPYSTETNFNYANAINDYIKFKLNANTSYAAMYTPHVKITDKFNDRELWVSPDGYAGAQISFTSSNYELWYPVGKSSINAYRLLTNTAKCA